MIAGHRKPPRRIVPNTRFLSPRPTLGEGLNEEPPFGEAPFCCSDDERCVGTAA